jgi:hypothetical protein
LNKQFDQSRIKLSPAAFRNNPHRFFVSEGFFIRALPFGVYVALKCVFAALLGGAAAALEMYVGMFKPRKRLN